MFVGEVEARLGARPTNRIPFTRIGVGQRVKVHFLWDFNEGIALYRHEGVPAVGREGRRSVTCHLNDWYAQLSNGHCPYCADGYPRKIYYFFLIWNHDQKSVELLSARRTSYSFVPSLKELFDAEGTIKGRDWVISRRQDESGRPNVTKYIALPGAPVDFKLPDGVTVPTVEEVKAFLAPPELS